MKPALTLLLLSLLFTPAYGNDLSEALATVEALQDYKKAEQVARKATKGLAGWKKAIVYSTLGWKLIDSGKYKKAEKIFKRAKKYSGNYYEIIGIAIARYNQGKYRDSLKIARKTLNKESPDAPIPGSYLEAINYILGINLQELNKLPSACIHWDRAYRIGKRHKSRDAYGEKSYKLIKQHCK